MAAGGVAGRPRNLSPLPAEQVRRAVMIQNWDWISFLHWRYDPDLVRQLLPPQLAVDAFDGAAWVGLTPFVARVRPPRLPAAFGLRFPETNVRTYVLGPDGKPGVWFFSLDAASAAAVAGARLLYGLPYRWSRMRVTRQNAVVEYRSRRRRPAPGAGSLIEIELGGPIAPVELGDLDNFLTARWRLYTLLPGGLGLALVEHPPWPLASARVLRLEQDLIQAAGLPAPQNAPVVHFSHGVEVRVGAPIAVHT